MHIIYTFIRVFKYKVDGVTLGYPIALDPVVVVVFIEWTLNEFRAVMCHSIHLPLTR